MRWERYVDYFLKKLGGEGRKERLELGRGLRWEVFI